MPLLRRPAGTSKAAQEVSNAAAQGRKQPARKAAAAANAAITSAPEDPFDFGFEGGNDAEPTPGMVRLPSGLERACSGTALTVAALHCVSKVGTL